MAGPGAVPGAAAAATAAEATCESVTARVALMQALAADGTTADALAELLAPAASAPGTLPAAAGDCLACRILAGDLTLDGRSGADDLVSWIDAWSRADWADGDLDRDGWIDDRDLAILLRRTMAEQADTASE